MSLAHRLRSRRRLSASLDISVDTVPLTVRPLTSTCGDDVREATDRADDQQSVGRRRRNDESAVRSTGRAPGPRGPRSTCP